MSTQISDNLIAEPVRWVRSQVVPWLEDSQRNPEQLVKWLQGDDLPAIGHDDPPYRWILEGLPVGADRHHYETLLATSASQLLAREPDRQPLGDRPAKLLYNLLLLCSHLTKRDILGEALYAMFERGQLNGEWNGVPLAALLRGALIMNQVDARLQSVWVNMCEGKPHAFLQGSLYDGIDGVRLMRPARDVKGLPTLDAIGKALKNATSFLEADLNRRQKFQNGCIRRILDTYPGFQTWELNLIMQADHNFWPSWAVECLPSLYIRFDTRPDGSEIAIVWHYILACLPKSQNYEILEKFCDGHVFKVALHKNTARLTRSFAPILEQKRLSNPFSSSRSTIAIVLDALRDLQVVAFNRDDPESAFAIEEARREQFEMALIEPDSAEIIEALQKIAIGLETEEHRESELRSLIEPIAEIYQGKLDLESQLVEGDLPHWAEHCLVMKE